MPTAVPRPPRAAVRSVIDGVARLLGQRIWKGSSERMIQDAIALVLDAHHIPGPHVAYRVEREYMLGPKERVDFALVLAEEMPDVIALEVKLAPPALEVARQIQRYAQHERVGAIVLAATSARVAMSMPAELQGVSVFPLLLRRM